MKINAIVTKVNNLLAGEMYPYDFLSQYMDEVIDDINTELSACFPTFTDLTQDSIDQNIDYTAIPDKYIRSVVVVGTAYKFYIMDEEGIDTAQMYGYRYRDALFRMLRDYVAEIPEEYQVDHMASLETNFETVNDPTIDPIIQGWGW